MTFVPRAASVHLKSMGSGKGRRDGGVWLEAEEALYLLERGTLDLRWGEAGKVGMKGGEVQGMKTERSMEFNAHGVEEREEGSDGADEDGGCGDYEKSEESDAPAQTTPQHPEVVATRDFQQPTIGVYEQEQEEDINGMIGLPVSLQAGFALLIGAQNLTLERYTVYVTLKRTGFIVKRAPTWHYDHDQECNYAASALERRDGDQDVQDVDEKVSRDAKADGRASVWEMMWDAVFERRRRIVREEASRNGPLVGKGLYRSYRTCRIPSFTLPWNRFFQTPFFPLQPIR